MAIVIGAVIVIEVASSRRACPAPANPVRGAGSRRGARALTREHGPRARVFSARARVGRCRLQTARTRQESSCIGATNASATTIIEYLVDGMGRRVGKKVNGAVTKKWLWRSQLQPVAELDASNDVVQVYVYTDGVNAPDQIITATAAYRLIKDHLGSVRLVVNEATGVVVQRIDYDSWGRVLTDTNPGFQPFGFAGGLYDADTGLVRFGARDYDPEIGRWVSKDPIRFSGGINLFEYSKSDPVNLIDPNGNNPWLAGGLIVAGGAALGIALDTFYEPTRDAQELRELGQLTRPQEDAYRHCLASCVASAHYGDSVARGLAWLNAGEGPGEDEDDFNDEFGRSLCGQLEDPGIPECKANCKAAATLGLLETYSP